MSEDSTMETMRRIRQRELNEAADERHSVEERYGQVWNTTELAAEFEVLCFMAPFVVVKRKSDGKKGTLEFQHSPRFYFNWQEDT